MFLGIFSGISLPKPKVQENFIDNKEDELEDFVQKKVIPTEKPPPKRKQPVKITIPSLPMVGIV